MWVRRRTWKFRWESAATINLACLAVCLVCIMPATTPTFDVLHSVTGIWNLEDLIGHIVYLSGLVTLTHVMMARLDVPDRRQVIRLRLEPMAALGFPTMVGLFIAGAPDHHVRDLTLEPAHGWLAWYWLVFCAMAVWILGNLAWALWIIRSDPGSRRVADLYLAAAVINLAGMASRAAAVVIGPFPERVGYALICFAMVGYGIAATYGMRRLRRWWRVHQWKEINRSRPRQTWLQAPR
ncbi:MAG: hypothetical protein VX424_23940 [Actinomycetota bacterium]|nr:hypothetical protein [Actinomycetota bacterium]